MQSLVERLGKAGWLIGWQRVTLEFSNLNWSRLGFDQMNKACDALIKTAPDFFKALDTTRLTAEDVQQPTPIQLIRLIFELQPVIAALQPPPLTEYEALVFCSMLTFYAREKALKQPPEVGGENPGPRFKF